MITAVLLIPVLVSSSAAQTVGARDMACAGRTLLQSALVLAQAVARSETVTTGCDVNGDATITNADVRAIQQCDVGMRSWAGCAKAGVDLPTGRETPENFADAIDFTESLATPPNVSGALAGHLAFIQTTLVTPKDNVNRPDLVPGREALLLFFPSDPNQYAISAQIGSNFYELAPPENLPHHDGPTGGEPIVYSKRAWSAVVAADDMQPGMSIRFTNGAGQSGAIASSGFTFGAPMEITTIALRIGMLVDELRSNLLTQSGVNHEIAVDYFNKTPVQKFRIAAYEPIDLQRVVLADGTVYTDKSAQTEVDVYGGDMRQQIAKSLIGSGIPFANIGVPAAGGITEAEPRPFRQTTIIATSGTYTGADGGPVVVPHGLVGGAGQVLLLDQRGNEFSHEYGHDYGLGHYPGAELSTQGFTGGWGYDIVRDRLIANFRWDIPDPEGKIPWTFNFDPMAGGGVTGSISSYTLHTPYSLQLMQDNIARQSGWLDPASPTGYTGWDFDRQTTVPWAADASLPKPDSVGRPVTTIVGFYDPNATLTGWIAPALHGNWGVTFQPSQVNSASKYPSTCQVTVKGNAADRVFNLPDARLKPNLMNQFHVNVPASFKATNATVVCGGKTLVSSALQGPVGGLTEVVEVGGDAGFSRAVLQIPLQKPEPTTTRAGLVRNLTNVFGPVQRYVSGTRPVAGALYEYAGGFYQAKTSAVANPPSASWRTILSPADVRNAIRTTTIGVGEKSAVYKDPATFVYYTVPADGNDVIASDVGARGGWYNSAPYGLVTVRGTSAAGETVPIVLRAQFNDRYKSNSGSGANTATYFTATYHAEDNPKVPRGRYSVDFEVRAEGWQTNASVDAFRVTGTVTVS